MLSGLFLYVDETGQLGLSSSAYFGLGKAMFKGEMGGMEWEGTKLRCDLQRNGARLPKGSHAKNDKESTREKIFDLIAKHIHPGLILPCCTRNTFRTSAAVLASVRRCRWCTALFVVLAVHGVVVVVHARLSFLPVASGRGHRGGAASASAVMAAWRRSGLALFRPSSTARHCVSVRTAA